MAVANLKKINKKKWRENNRTIISVSHAYMVMTDTLQMVKSIN